MSKRVTLESPLSTFFSLAVFCLVIAGLLWLQHIFNGELKVLYEEIGNVTKLTPSYVVTVIYFIAIIALLIAFHLYTQEDAESALYYSIFIVGAMLITAVWGAAVSANGLVKLTNNNAKICVTLPNSLVLFTGLIILYLGLLDMFLDTDRVEADEANPFITYLLIPLGILIISCVSTFFIYKIPNTTARGITQYGLAIVSFGVGIFFVLGVENCLFSSTYNKSYSGGSYYGGSTYHAPTPAPEPSYEPEEEDISGIDYLEHCGNVTSNLESELRRAYISGVSGFGSHARISGLSVEISGGTCFVRVHIHCDFTDCGQMTEYEADRRADEIGEEAKHTYGSIASDYLGDDTILDIDNIEVSVTTDVEYTGY